jgi:hypothetical protein
MRWSAARIVAVLVVALIAAPARAASPVDVDAAIAKAKKYIYSQQKNGNWERVERPVKDTQFGSDVTGPQWGGQTALALFALLVAGEDPQSKELAPAIEFLMKAELTGTYALGMRAQVLLLLPKSPAVDKLMRDNTKQLIGLMKTKGPGEGFYDYDAEGNSYSLSRAQYAVLGVWAAAQSGVEVERQYWAKVEKAWVAAQEKDGGWRYQHHNNQYPATAGITAVGIATLFIIQDQLYTTRGLDCKDPTEIPAIEKGIAWMSKNFNRVASDQKVEREYPNPNLYAVERVGVAGGLKYIGTHDWYKFGCEYLLRMQKKNGSWGGSYSLLSDTCFGVAFLSRGRAPVIFNKLDWIADKKSAGGNWNRRPRDVANATRWIGRSSERDFNWQIVNLESPIEDWHDAPILYLSGSDPLKIDKPSVEKMRRFTEDGGMLLINADCGRGGFIGSARKLASEMYPSYEFRELPADHPIYTTNFSRAKWKTKPSLLGVSNGVRELIILIPQADPAKAWQRGAFRGSEESWQLAANLVFYASDQAELKYKGERHFIADDPKAKTTASLKVARLQYKGNWDPEPGGWRRLRNVLRTQDKLDLTIEPVELATGKLDGVKVAHLTGTTKIKLDDAAKAQLKKFVADGGMLIVDAAGGSAAFASSVEADMESLGTGAKLEALPPDHSLFGAKDELKISYRAFAKKVLTGKTNVPRVKAVRVGDRPAILFSREDLSAGLVGNAVGGIVGYSPETATQLVRRMILRAANMPAAAPSTQPAKSTEKTEKPKSKKKSKKAIPADPATNSGTGLD